MTDPGDARRRGDEGENAALAHLEAAGLQLVSRNWRCPLGEIDLVMRDGEEMVFVEVRRRRAPRRGSRFASAAETIGPRKRARLVRAAQSFLATRPDPPACRFDVVAIDEHGDDSDLDWIRAAFTAD